MPIEGRSGPPIKGVPNYEGLQWYFNTYREIRTEINRECEFPGQSPEGFFYGVREVVKSYFKRTYNQDQRSPSCTSLFTLNIMKQYFN